MIQISNIFIYIDVSYLPEKISLHILIVNVILDNAQNLHLLTCHLTDITELLKNFTGCVQDIWCNARHVFREPSVRLLCHFFRTHVII